MLEELKKLEALQAIDLKIFNLEEEQDALPTQNDILKSQIDEKEKRLAALKSEIRIQVVEKEQRDEILKKGEEKLKTITGKQGAIRNKEEYNALLRDVDTTKRFNRDLSEEIEEIRQTILAKEAELAQIEEESNKEIAEIEQTISANEKRISEIEEILDDLYAKRDEVVKNIKPIVYNKYQRILSKSPNARAIATAENRVCLGCNMTLPPELFNMVLRSTHIEVCPNCQCILIPSQKPRDLSEITAAEMKSKKNSIEISDDDDE